MKRGFLIGLLLVTSIARAQSAPVLRVSCAGQTVTLTWTPFSGATQYLLRRADSYPNWNHNSTVSSSGSYDVITFDSVSASAAYVYQVIPQNSQGQTIGGASNLALVSTYAFTDPNLTIGVTAIKPTHITELRTAINAARAACGISAATWTNPSLGSHSIINRNDVAELRTALNAGLANIGLTPQPYADPTLDATTFIRAVHIRQLRTRLRNFPQYAAGGIGPSNRYFSPNGDGQKDTTSLGGSLATGDALGQYVVNVRNSSGVVLRSFTGFGPAVFSFVWDGRNASNALQPEGDYTAELVDLDSLSTPAAMATVTIDLTPPQSSITSPVSGITVSNVQGNSDLPVSGTTTDAHFGTWILEQTGNNQTTATIASGAAAVSPAALLGTWHTVTSSGALPNGSYTLRLTSTDLAGNSTPASVPVTVGHFSASQNTYELNLANSATVTYTSNIPYAMSETLTIKNATGTIVRTLVNNVQRSAGSYTDVWNGRNEQGQILPDGRYLYYVTANDGAHSYTWDRTSNYRNTLITNLSYPACINDAGSTVNCDDPSIAFDPFTNKPLHIVYCNYSTTGAPRGQCNASSPVLVEARVAPPGENDPACDSASCILQDYQSSGQHDWFWYGYSRSGAYVAGTGGLLFMRRDDSFPQNMTILFGTAPKINRVTVAHPMFDPWFGSESIAVDLTAAAGRTVTLSGTCKNLQYGSILRTSIPVDPNDSHAVLWDGRADNGEYVAPGVYEIAITVTDNVGSSSIVKPICVVRY